MTHQDGGLAHGGGEVIAADVPAPEDEVVRVDGGQHVAQGDVDRVTRRVVPEADGGSHAERPPVVSLLLPLLLARDGGAERG